jgi:hypothetical protein
MAQRETCELGVVTGGLAMCSFPLEDKAYGDKYVRKVRLERATSARGARICQETRHNTYCCLMKTFPSQLSNSVRCIIKLRQA